MLTRLSARLSRWTQDGVLQLQRRAYQSQGVGQWEKLDDDIPIMSGTELLEDLPMECNPPESIPVVEQYMKEAQKNTYDEENCPQRPLTWPIWSTHSSFGPNSIKDTLSEGSSVH
jgi:hypothetical protein